MPNYNVLHGDCLAVMRTLDANSIDAIVSDPPYGLSFMGKAWDHGVPGVEFWAEALRVAKPGTHLVAFGGTRTFHRLAVAIEDAGWEIRDCLSWLYGSGFPKSHDVSKQIDKMDAAEEQMRRRYRFTAWVRSMGLTARQIDKALGTNTMGRHYTDVLPDGKQPAIMTREHLEACRHLLTVPVPEWVERECDIRSVESKNFAEREVLETRQDVGGRTVSVIGRNEPTEFNVTAPATDLAKQWAGWGTALKPAWEPIILARKPLTGTVAANVTQYGTGAVNVDACRLGPSGDGFRIRKAGSELGQSGGWNDHQNKDTIYDASKGRWPANVVLDEDAAGMLDAQSGVQKSGTAVRTNSGGNTFGGDSPKPPMPNIGYGDSGGASRFFYCAKASRREREAGDVKNVHPTVKPIDLMRWLCRLVTPPNGTVLDPFNGSGSTGCAAVVSGFNYIGIELDAEYVEIAKRRIEHWVSQREEPDLFAVARSHE